MRAVAVIPSSSAFGIRPLVTVLIGALALAAIGFALLSRARGATDAPG